MLKKVNNINFLLRENNNEFNIYKEEIYNYWNQFSNKNPNVFNGNVISVSKIESHNDNYNLTINIIKFCDVIYSKMIGNIKTRVLFSGGYIITKDNYIGFVINKNNIVNLAGGMAADEDCINGKYNPNLCIEREFKEELGIDINSDKFNYCIKYLKCPSEDELSKNYYSMGLIYEIRTDYNKEELNDLFNNLNHDDEVISLLFLKQNEFFKLNEYVKKDYIDELCDLINEVLL